MMTPVHDVAIVDWKTHNYGVNQYAVRLGLSVITITKALKKEYLPPTIKHLFLCCSHYLKKHCFQYFHFIFAKIAKQLHHATQATKNNSLFKTKSSKQGALSHSLKHNFYNSRDKSLRYCNLLNSGTDVLWQQTKPKLTLRQSEGNGLRSYITEQPADDTTTATNEEK